MRSDILGNRVGFINKDEFNLQVIGLGGVVMKSVVKEIGTWSDRDCIPMWAAIIVKRSLWVMNR